MPRPAQRKLPPHCLRAVGVHPITLHHSGEIIHHLIDAGGYTGGPARLQYARKLRTLGKFRNMRIKGGRPAWELWIGCDPYALESELRRVKLELLDVGCMAMRWEIWDHGFRDRVLWADDSPAVALHIKEPGPRVPPSHARPLYMKSLGDVPGSSRCVLQLVGSDGS